MFAACLQRRYYSPALPNACLLANIQSLGAIATGIVFTMAFLDVCWGLNQFGLRCLNANGRDWPHPDLQ